MRIVFLMLFLLQVLISFAQPGKTFLTSSRYTSFPDTGRAKGHAYNNIQYPFAGYYDDSSVLILVPPQFKAAKKTDLVFWFHGWRNNTDSVMNYFEIGKQFLASKRNAILVLPESAKNSPDSYGGKLEQEGVFTLLVKDVLDKLKTEKIISRKAITGNVVLAGHSGAFRVIAHILQNGGTEVKETILFDALYSQVDKFTAWIQSDSSHRFIHLYTNKGGGTDEESAGMMQLLRSRNIPFINPEEKEVTETMLKQNNIIFIHSLKEHNDVINRPDHNFRLFVETSRVLGPVF